MATDFRLKKGKLYRVADFHPERVTSPKDMCYYPAEIVNGNSFRMVETRILPSRGRFLELGQVFMYLGNMCDASGHYFSYEYSVILLGENVLASNCCIEKTHAYYELEEVGSET